VDGRDEPGHDGGEVVPLQNRVSPFGELLADSTRGLFMGNRGGRLHDEQRKLGRRRWTTRAWICCRLEFNQRYRRVWGDGYTELFFLDEVTALAAGHRPCFECRRKDAEAFAECWRQAFGLSARPRAAEMDAVLHAQRLDGRDKRRHRRNIDDMPDGAFASLEEGAFAVRGHELLHWAPNGYDARRPRVRNISVDVLTPPAILSVFAAGYRPHWHPSADKIPDVVPGRAHRARKHNP
jgi:hypothetical protein